jgi:hypothetical protein
MNTNTGVIIGNMVRDAELKFTPDGLAIADFTIFPIITPVFVFICYLLLIVSLI